MEKKEEVVDVEVLSSREDSSSSYSERRYTYVNMSKPSAPGHQGLPLASTITMTLLFFCLFKWGFLSALGFLFFYAIGSALGVYRNMRSILQGQTPNPWTWRIGNWIVSTLLVANLS